MSHLVTVGTLIRAYPEVRVMGERNERVGQGNGETETKSSREGQILGYWDDEVVKSQDKVRT